ncbi:uncharacterized protein LY89DRAFT_723404 [Mollisia scopiformis]|uniref:Uncharacterized protein n=1 Tax=Mollisia scopiformis TaxID=149040 RepID=A0A194WTB9_MOLSC|nr:uncharacterized protein LY89DRAFT_723404 [Mollisia scopiformis]KUJ10857.1 hypothetical protein LY89DRAFT_723404 [Mollisia scopiformis]
MADLVTLISQYDILELMSHHLAALDLLRLASTNSNVYSFIRKSEPIFDRLKRVTLCDGHGLKARQDYKGIYELPIYDGKSADVMGRKMPFDEELEVRVWNRTCDPTNGLPCLKCGINVCEECRFVPRVKFMPNERGRQKQHFAFTPYPITTYVMCFCTACDEKVERGLPFSLSEYCDCDQYKRWICLPCKVKEEQMNIEYLKTRTKVMPGDGSPEEGTWFKERYGEYLAIWCPCGERAPYGANIRCLCCKRRHNLDTWKSSRASLTPFNSDPCYPGIDYDGWGNQIMYPRMGYKGPIAP